MKYTSVRNNKEQKVKLQDSRYTMLKKKKKLTTIRIVIPF